MVRRNIQRRRRRMPRKKSRRNSAFNSRIVRIAPTPKSSSLTVWNSYVIQRTITVANGSTANITIGYIYDALINLLALSGSPTIDVRIMSYEAYDLAGRPIAMQVFDLDTELIDESTAVTSLLRTAYDYPGRNNWARVKIVLPKTITSNPITLKTGAKGVAAAVKVGAPLGIANVTSTSVLVKIYLLWQTNGPDVIGSSQSLFLPDYIVDGKAVSALTTESLPDVDGMAII